MQCGVVRFFAVLCCVVGRGVVQCGVVWFFAVLCGGVVCGEVWCGSLLLLLLLLLLFLCLHAYAHTRILEYFSPMNYICKQEESAVPSQGQIRSMTMLAPNLTGTMVRTLTLCHPSRTHCASHLRTIAGMGSVCIP